MKFILSFFLFVSCAWILPSVRAEIGLISPADARALIEHADPGKRPVVLDTRGGYKDYFRGHLPTAQHLNFDTLRGTDAGVPVQYLPDELTAVLLERAGVDKNRLHLIYATGESLPNDEVLSATMVAYVLEKFGVEQIRIVDGGLKSWVEMGFKPIQAYFANPVAELPLTRKPEIASTIDDVLAAGSNEEVIFVDARPHVEFIGEDEIWFRKGHIPGAVSFHWARFMEESNTHQFRSFTEVKEALESAGITPDKTIICYCGTSREGSLLRFYLKYLAGYPKVTLYEGAWKEYVWLRDQSLPVEISE